jgi:capsular exopolysaccharide synthesis family protein
MSDALVKEKTNEASLRNLYYVLFRHKWKMTVFFLAVIFTVTVVTFMSDEIYRSKAKLLVRIGRESVTLDPTAATGKLIQVTDYRQNQINSELEILRSQELLEKVVDSIGYEAFLRSSDAKISNEAGVSETIKRIRQGVGTAVNSAWGLLERLGLVRSLSSRDKVVLGVINNLGIGSMKDSSIITLSCDAKSPQLAQQIVARLIELYLEKHIAVHQTPGSYQFFVQQSDHLRDKLKESEDELRNLKNETGISSLEDQRRVVLNHIGALEQEISSADAGFASSKAKVEALQKALNIVPEVMVTQETTGYPNYAADTMREEIFKLQLEELKMLTNFTEESRMAEAVHQEVVEAQSLLDMEEPVRTQVTRGLSTAHEQLKLALLTEEANLSSLEAKVEAQKNELKYVRAELRTLNDAEVRIANLMREISTREANYSRYSENLEQARIDKAMESERISNISVVQPATLPIKAVRPNKLLNLALGLFVGILGSVILAIFSEHLDHSIKTPEEAEERLQLPTLTSIPRVRGVRSMRVFPTVKWKRQAKAGVKKQQKVPTQLDIPAKIREHYEAFRERLLLCSNGSTGRPYILGVTGYHRHEGVSTVATNLATVLSRRGYGEVLLVDANICHPLVHQIFKAKLSPGLADIFSNGQSEESAIQSLPAQNLHILSAGSKNRNLSEIFDSTVFAKLLNSMKSHYRYVVIDVPALSEDRSVARLASLCDGVVLVVEAEHIRWEVAQKAKEQLLDLKANVLGVVLNKRRFHIPRWLYQTL